MDQVRIGIIGIGNMGSGHARYLSKGAIEGAVLAAVCDINPDRLAWAAKELPETVKQFDDAITMLDSGEIDAVIVAVPHYDHPKYVMAAAERGIHAICEKPAGVYTKQAREMIEFVKEKGIIFSMMFNQRTNPCYQKLREMIKGGELGELKRTNWIITDWYRTQAYYNSGGWRATWSGEGGGVLINQCPHQLDLWQWTCGMPKRVRAFCQFGRYHDIEVEDNVTAYVEYENGATGVFITTTGEFPGTNRFEIIGEMGKVVIEGTTLTFYKNEVSDAEYSRTAEAGFGKITNTPIEYTFEDKGPQHEGITQNFVNAILKGEKLLGPGEEGIYGLTISNAMHLSTWLDDWVDLPLDEDLFLEKLNERVAASKEKTNVNAKVENTEGTY